MRTTRWIVTIVPKAVLGLSLAWAAAPTAAGGTGCSRCGLPGGYAAPVHAMTAAPGMTQACCDSTCHPCDNAWAGYCEQKARKQAFYARVGAPKPSRAKTHAPVGSRPAEAYWPASQEVYWEPAPAGPKHPDVQPLPPVLDEPVEPAESPRLAPPPPPEPAPDRSAAQYGRSVKTGFSSSAW